MTSITPSRPALPSYASSLIPLLISSGVLTFGSYTLKSGRPSPYFFNLNNVYSGPLLHQLAQSYAQAIVESPMCNPAPPTASSGDAKILNIPTFDVLFGPAYKGIPLASTICVALSQPPFSLPPTIAYAFNRKEAKDHGEGGVVVGCPLKNKKVFIIDDVMTSGMAMRESYEIIKAQGGEVVGVAVILDREEKGRGGGDEGMKEESAVQEVSRAWNVPVVTVLTLGDIIEYLRGLGGKENEVRGMEEHREKFGVRKTGL